MSIKSITRLTDRSMIIWDTLGLGPRPQTKQLEERVRAFVNIPGLSQARRSFSTSAHRINAHLSLSERERFTRMTKAYLDAMEPESRENFLEKYGVVNGSKEQTLQSFKKLCENQTKPASQNRWTNYPIDDVECLPGCGKRFSSSSAAILSEVLPNALKLVYGNSKPSLIEVGGFTFNDMFLLNKTLTDSGFEVAEHIGVDIHHDGKIAAEIFNKKIAKIDNFKIVLGDAVTAISTLAATNNDKFLIALRFLAVLEAEEIFAFFYELKKLLKPDEILIFNYTLYNAYVKNLKNKSGWTESTNNGIHVLRKDNVHYQTSIQEDTMTEILDKFGFRVLLSKTPQIETYHGSDLSRGQHDKYERNLVITLKDRF